MVRTDIKRLWLRERWSKVPGTHATLLVSLQAQAFASVDGVKSGTISSTSANGHAVAFETGNDQETPGDFAALGGEMLDHYDASNAALIASGIPTPTDLQIYTEMLDRLQSVRSYTKDYSDLRTGGVNP